MKRRGFLGALFGTGAALAAVGSASSAKPKVESEEEPERYPVKVERLPGSQAGLTWLEPVEAVCDLPAEAIENSVLFVTENDRCYIASPDGYWMTLTAYTGIVRFE